MFNVYQGFVKMTTVTSK